MEGLQKRKNLRLTLPGAMILTPEGSSIKVNNISLEGINLQGFFPIDSKIQGVLTLSGNQIGRIDILIVNQQKDSSGGMISNYQELSAVLSSWFNPTALIANLVPSEITDSQLSYEDYNHKCRFNFEFNHAKKINKVEISVYESKILWDTNGWQTGVLNKIDGQPDVQKIKLAKTLIRESVAFPQSFKDWLLNLN